MKKTILTITFLLLTLLLVSCGVNKYDDHYIVVFYTDQRNSEVSLETIQVDKDSYVSEPELDLEGKPVIFDGWYKDRLHTEEFDFNTDKVTESMTIFIKWIYPQFKINYMLAEDEINHPNNIDVYIHANVGSNGLRVRDASKEGYRFRGWYLNAEYPESTTKIDFVTLDLFGEDLEEIDLYPRFTKLN